ncbi:hypothetical protein LTR91_020508 [Friedmanniomyces endolithicus]|uniref:Uncharacterized protein n=1 Tax=Friedmanniomyces endolithicus TaxID=329885 RepID=A0AAN6K4V2_9PEZI|nr:hypothetical protein LTR57_021857 [Friedmanniomyces endolithicus]KAK0931037.1 hypothetical protein LTR29_016477 [Friedmanniomyces endolithicus]KAK0959132.1 hypothetical protein LTS01_021523 [Friedmanniomyces endolithicus]KAK0960106.1 hypothetical protein LTR91_020508 [Friedmanniomyces endolithicus]KAK1024473.1 hypothetical protein LTS16_024017 [Friedmanniomyces endolithicus]
MDVDESVLAEAAEYLLAAFYRSKPTGLRWETFDPLGINDEIENFMRKISFKVRSLVQTVEYGELHMDQVRPSSSTTCRSQDLLIFDDTSTVDEAGRRGRRDQALSLSSMEGPSLLDSQLENIDTHQPTSNTDQRPQENEHNGLRTAPVEEPGQLGSDPHSEKSRKRRQSGVVHGQDQVRARKKSAVTSRSAQNTQSCSRIGDVVAKMASPRVILQLREILSTFPTSKIYIDLNVSDVGLRDLCARIIDRDNIPRIHALAQCLDIHQLYQTFYQQISGQSSRAFEVLTPRSSRPGLSGNPLRRRNKAVTERFVKSMLSELDPVKPAARKYCEDISKFGGRLYDMVDILGKPIVCLLVFAGAKEENALDWRRNTYGRCGYADERDLADDRKAFCRFRLRFQNVFEEASDM